MRRQYPPNQPNDSSITNLKRDMKIAFVVHDFLSTTGHGRYCIELARRFSGEHEIHVLANRFEPNLEFPFTPRFVKAWRSSALTSVLTFPGAAQKILDSEPFDIIHAQGYSSRRADIITAHVCNATRYMRSPARGFTKRLFPFFVIPRERAFYANARAAEVIAVSKVLERELQTEYHIHNTTVIYHGIDTESFSPLSAPRRAKLRQQMQIPENQWTWLFVGEAVKGLRQAIEALDQFPEAHLLVVTRSPLHPWRVFAQKHAHARRVTFHAATHAIERYYQVADLFLYPSDYDTFGMVVAEAMGCGLPVIVGQNIGAAEWISPGKNGFLCDPRNALDISAQLREVKEGQNQAIPEMGIATARAHSWDRCAEETMLVYQRAIFNKRQKR